MVNNRYCTVTNIVAFSCVHHKVVAHVIMSQRSIASFFSKSSSLLIYKGGKYILRTYMVYRFYVALYRKNKFLPVQGTGWWKRLVESDARTHTHICNCLSSKIRKCMQNEKFRKINKLLSYLSCFSAMPNISGLWPEVRKSGSICPVQVSRTVSSSCWTENIWRKIFVAFLFVH